MKRLLSIKCATILCFVASAALSIWLLALSAGDSTGGRLPRDPITEKSMRVGVTPSPAILAPRDPKTEEKPSRTPSRRTASGATGIPDERAAESESPPDSRATPADFADAELSPVPPRSDSQQAREVRRSTPILPLAFQEDEPGALFTAPAHAAVAASIQDQFIEDIGGESADPSTPAYRKRWPSAQRIADLRLRARIGGQAFARYQKEAHARAIGQPVGR